MPPLPPLTVQVTPSGNASIPPAPPLEGETPGVIRELPSSTITIPVRQGASPVTITVLQPSDISTNEDGDPSDPAVRQAVYDNGYEFHMIADRSGNMVTVLMKPEDWTRYQTGLSDFARLAASNPVLYQPNSASQPLGVPLFSPTAHAGGSRDRSAPTPFHPLTNNQIRGAGIRESTWNQVGEGSSPVLVTLYEATNDAQRSLLLNAGYVEVQVRSTGDTTLTRFAPPLDAALYRTMAPGHASMISEAPVQLH